MQKPTIDFTGYSDDDLEAALITINRFDFEANYQACLAEKNKRISEEKWNPTLSNVSPINVIDGVLGGVVVIGTLLGN